MRLFQSRVDTAGFCQRAFVEPDPVYLQREFHLSVDACCEMLFIPESCQRNMRPEHFPVEFNVKFLQETARDPREFIHWRVPVAGKCDDSTRRSWKSR